MTKKIKLKRKFIILIIIIIIIFSIYKLIINITNKQNESDKYEGLEKIDYYNENNKERYLKYKQNNKDLTDNQIIRDVNMNLDSLPYKNIEPAKTNKEKLILVNKHYYLEEDYIPNNLEEIDNRYALKNMKMVKIAKDAFESLAKDARENNLSIIAMSTYRSFTYQKMLYDNYVKEDGKEKADTYSGRPGHSEHQTGLAVDVYNGKKDYTNFEETEEFKWMQQNAYKYGFILRFPKDKIQETGYMYESWHYRYVGKKAAKYIHKNKVSLEEYYATKIKEKY